MNKLAADGWRVQSASPSFCECSVLWEHPDLDSYEEYLARDDDEDKGVPLAHQSARAQYRAQAEASLPPAARAGVIRRREEARRQREADAAQQRAAENDAAQQQAAAAARPPSGSPSSDA